jgi:pimeloyl-ACP methyl ester carboxylesterase
VATVLLLVFSLRTQAQQIVTGSAQDGSTYEIAMPSQWNGILVVYAHGIDDPQEPLVVPSQDSDFAPFRDAIVAQGYAVASSSWSTTGYAVKDGVQRTHQLTAIFKSQFGNPQRTILVGKSLGGLVVVKIAEQYPSQYDGVLSMCGTIGGGSATIAYLANERAVFDYFFPGALPGDVFHTPSLPFTPPPSPSPAFLSVYGSLVNGLPPDPDLRTIQFASAAHLQVNASNPFVFVPEVFQAALEGLAFSVRFDQDLLSRTHGGIPYDNTNVVYTGSFDDAALNAGIERFSSDPNAVNYVQQHYDPTGQLQIPMLTIHTTLDPIAPLFNERLYAQKVAQAGASALLVQQTVNRFDHCNFQLQEKLNAFDALAGWVANPNQKPSPGDVTLP